MIGLILGGGTGLKKMKILMFAHTVALKNIKSFLLMGQIVKNCDQKECTDCLSVTNVCANFQQHRVLVLQEQRCACGSG